MAKILFLTDRFHPDVGGIETVSEILATAFAKARHEIRLVTWSTGGLEKDFFFKIIRSPGKIRLVELYRWADVVFENNPCLRLSWPNLFFRKPHVISLHTWISRINGKIGLRDQIKLAWLQRASKVIACSSALQKRCFRDAVVIGNPYDDDVFKRLESVEKTKGFVFLGRLVSDKGVETLVNAFYEFLIRQTNAGTTEAKQLTIIGDGPERLRLETRVRDLGIDENVTFTGSLRDESLTNLLNQHRYLVVPSVWEEPFGLVALEGMACGCVPIVSDGGGLPDAIGQAGIMFERGDADSLVEAMCRLFDDPALDQTLRKHAAGHLKAHRPEIVARKYLDVVEVALSP